MASGVVLNVDGTADVVQFDRSNELEVLSRTVGGFVEAVTLRDGCVLWVNEEGKLMRLPVNERATSLFVQHHGAVDVIVGPAVVTGPADEEGYMTDVPETYRG